MKATCIQCDYPLRGLPEAVCPECGTSFDPDDPTTFVSGVPNRLRTLRPPSPLNCWTIVALTALGVFDISVPGGGSCWMIPGYFVWFVLVLASLIRWAGAATGPRATRDTRRWLVAPVCIAVLVPTLLLPWPMWIRFMLSQASLERAAKAERNNAQGTPQRRAALFTPRWLGLYRVSYTFVLGGTGVPNPPVGFATGGFIDQYGFVHVPAGQPRPTGFDRLEPIAPGWYVFYERF